MLDIGEQQQKFIAALATDGVRLTPTGNQAFCDGLQQLVAHGVPQRIVDVFEAVQVHEHHRQLPALTARDFNGLAKAVLHQHSVGQIGECIVMGQMIEFNFC